MEGIAWKAFHWVSLLKLVRFLLQRTKERKSCWSPPSKSCSPGEGCFQVLRYNSVYAVTNVFQGIFGRGISSQTQDFFHLLAVIAPCQNISIDCESLFFPWLWLDHHKWGRFSKSFSFPRQMLLFWSSTWLLVVIIAELLLQNA